jgi:hypothetical protein
MKLKSIVPSTYAGLAVLLGALSLFSLAGCGGPKETAPNAAHDAKAHDHGDDAGMSAKANEDADIRAERAKLGPEDQRLVATQEFCAISTDARLGSMGPPVKVSVKGHPVFLCCKGCQKKALANPDKTLASVEELKAKVEAGAGKDDPHAAHGGGKGDPVLMVETDPVRPAAGKPTTLKLMIHGAGGAVVKDFAVVHEQKVHLIVVRDGLDQFAHLHPAVDATGNLTVSYTFPTGGTYRLYADHQPAGGRQATARGEVKVAGDAPPAPAPTPDVPGKVAGDGLRAEVTVAGATVGGEATIGFDLADKEGRAVTDLQPYMGAMGHLVVLSRDGKQYVHAHPAEGKADKSNRVVFMAHFMKAGLYKGWGQFRRSGKVEVVPFVIEVE